MLVFFCWKVRFFLLINCVKSLLEIKYVCKSIFGFGLILRKNYYFICCLFIKIYFMCKVIIL